LNAALLNALLNVTQLVHMKISIKFNASLALGLLAACLFTAPPASATVVTSAWQNATFNFASIDDNTTLNFDGFDSGLGRLIDVVLKFTLNETLINDVFNFGRAPVRIGSPGAVSATSTVTVSAPLSMTLTNSFSTPGFVGMVPVGGPTQVKTATLPIDFLVGIVTRAGDPLSLAAYIGGSNSVAIDVTGFGNMSGTLPAAVFAGYEGSSYGVVSLQYQYDVPEPASIALFSLGLIGLAAMLRRRA
jgi:hypothetical protein